MFVRTAVVEAMQGYSACLSEAVMTQAAQASTAWSCPFCSRLQAL